MWKKRNEAFFPFFLFEGGLFDPSKVESAELLQWLYNSTASLPINYDPPSTLIDTSTLGDDRQVQPGRGYLFDGVDDYVDGALSTDIGTGDYTVTLWIRPDDLVAGWESLFGFGNFAPGLYSRNVTNNKVTLFESGTKEFDASLVAGTWYHLALVRNSGTVSLYVDGAVDAQTFASTTDLVQTFGIATDRPSGAFTPFTGPMYDFRIYNSALSAGDIADVIANNYASTLPLVWYKMDEAAGATAYDSSGNADDATINNATPSTFHTTFTNGRGSDFQNQVGHSDGINYLIYSNDFSQASAWSNAASFTHAAASTSPVGISSAQKVTQSSSAVTYQAITAPSTSLLYFIYYKDPNYNGNTPNANFAFLIRNQTTTTNLVQVYLDRASSFDPVFLPLSGTGSAIIDPVDANGWRRINLRVDSGFTAGDTVWFYPAFNGVLSTPVGASIELAAAMVEDVANTTQTSARTYQDTTTVSLGGVYIPRDESTPTQGVLGNPLDYTGRVPYDGLLVNSNCATFDGVDDYVDAGVTFPASGTIECYFKYDTLAATFKIAFGARTVSTQDLFFGIDGGGGYYLEIGDRNWNYPTLVADTEWRKTKIVYGSGNVSWQIALLDEDYPTAEVNTYGGILPTHDMYLGGLNIADVPSTRANVRISKFTVSSTVEYAFAEGSGTTIYDVSGNGNHGNALNITPASFWANTQSDYHYNITSGFSNRLEFDGATNVITKTSMVDTVSDGEFTWSIRINADTKVSYDSLVSINGTNLGFYIKDGVLNFWDGADNLFDTTLSTHASYHLVVTRDASDVVRAYIDGVEESTTHTITDDVTGSTTLRVGNDTQGTTYFDGNLLEVQLFNRQLSAAEVLSLFNGAEITTGLELKYNIDEGTGASIGDSSGNSRDGVLTGSANWLKAPALQSGSADTLGGVISNPAGNYHNNSETQINRNPIGAPQLVNAGVSLDNTINFGDDFLSIDPPWDYKRENLREEQDYLIYDMEPSIEDLFNLGDWLGVLLAAVIVDEAGDNMVDESGSTFVTVF